MNAGELVTKTHTVQRVTTIHIGILVTNVTMVTRIDIMAIDKR